MAGEFARLAHEGDTEMFRIIATAALGLALSACTYVSARTTLLDDRTAVISARGSSNETSADVVQKVLVTAAMAAQARGYEYFQIAHTVDASSTGSYVRAAQEQTNTYGTASCAGYYCSGSATSNTTFTPATSTPWFAPGADVTVRFFHAYEISSEMTAVWNSASVLAAQKKR